jgi:uncharacterized circularly permuted ATP-grasp superfamily protein
MDPKAPFLDTKELVRHRLTELAQSGRFGSAFCELTRALAGRGMSFEGKNYVYNPAPLLIAESDALEISRRAEALAGVFEKVGRLYSTHADTRAFFSGYEKLERLALVDVPYSPMAHLNRFDTAWFGGSDFKVLEANCACPAGVTSNAITRAAWRSVRDFASLLEGLEIADSPIDNEHTFAASLKTLASTHRNTLEPTIGLANYNGEYTFELDFLEFALKRLGCRTVMADLSMFHHYGAQLRCGDHVVDLVYNKLDPLKLRDGYEHLDYFRAYAGAAFVCVNGFRSQIILEDKAVLALLHDRSFAHLFDPTEKALITAHIPWTTYVREGRQTHPSWGEIDLVPFLIERREQLVLKPSNQTRGIGVTVGAGVGEVEWRALISAAVGGEWVVQEYCPLPCSPTAVAREGRFRMEDWRYSLDIFMFGGRCAGLTSRSNRGDVINVGSGGMRSPVFVVAQPAQTA